MKQPPLVQLFLLLILLLLPHVFAADTCIDKITAYNQLESALYRFRAFHVPLKVRQCYRWRITRYIAGRTRKRNRYCIPQYPYSDILGRSLPWCFRANMPCLYGRKQVDNIYYTFIYKYNKYKKSGLSKDSEECLLENLLEQLGNRKYSGPNCIKQWHVVNILNANLPQCRAS